MRYCKIVLTIILFFLFGPICAQDTVSVMTYNVLNYPNANGSARNSDLKRVISTVKPDLLFVQEMNSFSGVTGFLSGVLNIPGTNYASAVFIDGFDLDRNLYYKSNKFTFISNTAIATALRDINMYKLSHTATGDTIIAFCVHLKASSGTTNENKRAAEVDSLRNITDWFDSDANFFVCGDFNIYGSTEPAYQKLLEKKPGQFGHFNDLFSINGTWNNGSYSNYHTQSTSLTSNNGGASGGLDDRFDMILFSDALLTSGGIDYLQGSYKIIGNDGNHYNSELQSLPNASVADSVALSLYNASDHLPVVTKLLFTPELLVELQNKTNATCADSGNGSINIIVTGGIQPYSYIWSTGNTNKDLLNVPSGNYTLTVTGANGEQKSISSSISSPSPIQITTSKQNVSCNSLGNGTANLIATGGVSPYNYSWNTTPASTTTSVGQLNGGLYTARITDLNNCEKSVSVNIFEPSALSVFSILTHPTQGSNNGSVNLLVSGGIAPYTFNWSNGATTEDIFNVPAGFYFVTTIDRNGCAKLHVVILS